jgi:peptide/nickel transport system substrate-binding protein
VKGYVGPSAAALLLIIAVASCGGSSSSAPRVATSATSPTSGSGSGLGSGEVLGSSISLLMGQPPGSLDPAKDDTKEGAEVNWLVYTGLTTYRHVGGKAGTTLIPGLATALPKISDGGRTYTVTLRKGLKYSNGRLAKASDFSHAVERAIRVPWGRAGQFITPIIVGATAYATGRAKTISGIRTNDATGEITIRLTEAYGPFDNVLAFPSMALVPSSAPLKAEPSNPPPGVGPYRTTNIVPGRSFSVVRNSTWAPIPGIPSGKVNVNVKISANAMSNALAVLNNAADVLDYGDTVPSPLLAQIRAKARGRFANVDLGGSTYYVFFNTTRKPFNSQLAREAVVAGLDENVMNRLSSGTLAPGCYFLPPAVRGHPSAPCPYSTPGTGDLATAKALVKASGAAGTPVTVWSETRSPRQQWMSYYTAFLNAIGFKARERVLTDASYFKTIGTRRLHPQTGFANWNEDFANPVDFYLLLDGNAIVPTDNENFGEVNDPKINNAVATLGQVPTTQLASVTSKWQAIDEYVAKKAYLGVFGYQTFPKFMSARMNYGATIFHPVYGWDLSSFSIK